MVDLLQVIECARDVVDKLIKLVMAARGGMFETAEGLFDISLEIEERFECRAHAIRIYKRENDKR